MTSREVAQWLNNCTDEEFAEVFAYMYYGDRHMPDSLTPQMIKATDVNYIGNHTRETLDEIINSKEVCASAWWKGE